MTEQRNYYAAPDARLEPDNYTEADEHASRKAPTTFGGTINASIELYKKAFVPLIGISLAWGIIDGVTDFVHEWAMVDFFSTGDLTMAALFGMMILVTFVCSVFFWAVGLRRVTSVYETGSSGDDWSLGMQSFLPMAVYFILMGLILGAVTLVSFLVLVGPAILIDMPWFVIGLLTMLACLPAAVVLILLFVGDIHVAVTGQGPIAGLKKSYELVKGVENWLFAFGTLIVMGLMIFLPVFVVAFCMGGMVLLITESNLAMDLTLLALSPVISVVVYPFVLSFNFMLYQALLARKNFYYAAMSGDPAAGDGWQVSTQPASAPQGTPYGGRQYDGTPGPRPGTDTAPTGRPGQHRNERRSYGPPAGSGQGPPPGAEGLTQKPTRQSGEDGKRDGSEDDDPSTW